MKNVGQGKWILDYNKNRVEVKFPRKPCDEILKKLNQSNFTYAWNAGFWWAKDT
ncbi:hypothetical protein [Paenibacillus ferrarius]|uniref:hypothetical protein n=1 Tax=Paenibacillus ferrarius TaxID=1469647 RepID=UPI001301F0BF|nr:hypothetical protein [Paenibacillus ferrarius]